MGVDRWLGQTRLEGYQPKLIVKMYETSVKIMYVLKVLYEGKININEGM